MKHLSASSINMFLRCQQQWYFRYVEGEKAPPAVAMVQGTSVHKSAEYNYAYKQDTEEDLPLDDVQDKARDTFEAEKGEIEEEYDEGPIIDQTVSLAGLYHSELAPAVQPVHVEREFFLHNPEWRWPLKGFPDVETDTETIDLKVVGKKKSQDDLATDLQAGIYSLERLNRGGTPGFSWHQVVKTKTPKTLITSRAELDPTPVVRRVTNAQEAIYAALKSGVFLAADPSNWACSERFCGYWPICEYGGKQ